MNIYKQLLDKQSFIQQAQEKHSEILARTLVNNELYKLLTDPNKRELLNNLMKEAKQNPSDGKRFKQLMEEVVTNYEYD